MAVCATVSCAPHGLAQDVDASGRAPTITTLSDGWRCRTGDDPRWAAPTLDIDQWRRFWLSDTGRRRQPDWPRGSLWCRVPIRLGTDAGTTEWGVLIRVMGGYELYANGERIGAFAWPAQKRDGPLAALGSPVGRTMVYALPKHLTQADRVVLVLRTYRPSWGTPGHAGIPLTHDAMIGPVRELRKQRDAITQAGLAASLPSLLVAFAALLTGRYALGWFAQEPDHREYLWFGLLLIGHSVVIVLDVVNGLAGLLPMGAYRGLRALAVGHLFYIPAIWSLVHKPPGWPSRLLLAALGGVALLTFFDPWINMNPLPRLLLVAGTAVPLGFAARQAWRGSVEMRHLLPALALYSGWPLYFDSVMVLRGVGLPLAPPQMGWQVGPFYVSGLSLATLVFVLSTGLVLSGRHRQLRRERDRMEHEMHAAAELQSLLLSRPAAAPGFAVDIAFRPATEVGGDFYQVLVTESGSLLVVVGDVSGKGLRAALLVSLTVGLLQRIARSVEEPGLVLTELNRELQGRCEGSFITCCACLLRTGGLLTVANAGHIPPYVNGQAAAGEGHLPLGVLDGVTYPETTHHLEPGATLTLVSDGVAEARDGGGGLFGFEKVEAHLGDGAAALADAAQRHGQEDDITVVAVTRELAGARAA